MFQCRICRIKYIVQYEYKYTSVTEYEYKYTSVTDLLHAETSYIHVCDSIVIRLVTFRLPGWASCELVRLVVTNSFRLAVRKHTPRLSSSEAWGGVVGGGGGGGG